MSEQEVGVVHHCFDKIGVAAVFVTAGALSVGDTIHVMGATTNVTASIASMQIDNNAVEHVKKGDAVGMQIGKKVREHDRVFKVIQ